MLSTWRIFYGLISWKFSEHLSKTLGCQVDFLRAARDKRAMAVVVTNSTESDIMDTRRDSEVIPAVNGASGYGGFAI